MPKIDFLKIESELARAMYNMFMKKIVEGGDNLSERARIFYQSEAFALPRQDFIFAVIEEMREEAKESIQSKKEEDTSASIPPGQRTDNIVDTGESDAALEGFISRIDIDKIAPQPGIITEAAKEGLIVEKMSDPRLLLSKHLEWFKEKKVKDVYTILGTTVEAMEAFQKKEVLSLDDKKVLFSIAEKATALKEKIMQELGLHEDDTLIEAERKKHLTKRFNVRDKWVPL